jgi:hypothetical protein
MTAKLACTWALLLLASVQGLGETQAETTHTLLLRFMKELESRELPVANLRIDLSANQFRAENRESATAHRPMWTMALDLQTSKVTTILPYEGQPGDIRHWVRLTRVFEKYRPIPEGIVRITYDGKPIGKSGTAYDISVGLWYEKHAQGLRGNFDASGHMISMKLGCKVLRPLPDRPNEARTSS